ncbi:MAG: diguanylate cyclase (GGDEF)-like protein [Alphaproteobacteria bacterium]|jgi:diguanylate cyclase (GGDEF)-like protein
MIESEELTAQLSLIATQANSTAFIGAAMVEQARNHMEQNRYDQAVPLLESTLRIFTSLGDEERMANSQKHLAETYRLQAKYAEALELYYVTLQIYERLDLKDEISSMHNSIANILERIGHYQRAIESYQKSLELHREQGNNEGIASVLYNLGAIWQSMGDNDLAMTHFQDSLMLDLEAGDLKGIAYSHNKLGYVYNLQGRREKARIHINEAIRLFTELKTPRDIDWATSSLAKLELDSGDLVKAKALITGVIERAEENRYQTLLTHAYVTAIELALTEKNPKDAVAYAEKGVQQAKLNNERQRLLVLLKLNVDAHVLNGSLDKAFFALQQQKRLDDETFNDNLSATVAQAKTATEFMRKEQQVVLLENEKTLQQATSAQQASVRNVWAIGIASLFILLAVLYRSYTQRNLNKHLGDLVERRTKELKQKNEELQSAYSEMEAISLTDKLTGLNNRRFLENHIEADIERSIRQFTDFRDGKTERPSSADIVFFLIDMDNFKKVNDEYGHEAGDLVLKQFASRMQSVFRQSDYMIRWGGEEFVGVARFIEKKDAPIIAQRMLEMVSKFEFALPNGKTSYQTCSIGYVSIPLMLTKTNELDWHTFISMADACLYAAKYSGKNTWIGIKDISAADLTSANVTRENIALWHGQQKVELTTSLPSTHDIKWDSM